MNESQRVGYWQELARRHPEIQQFGQSNSTTTRSLAGVVGAKGCTQTVLQLLELGWHGRKLTIDEVSHLAGYPTQRQVDEDMGMVASQVTRFLEAVELPYRIIDFEHTASIGGLMRRANLHGPVAFGAAYSDQPEWMGATYRGVTADGKPNGYASPHGKAGKTQLVGFTGAHMELLLGYHVTRDPGTGVVIRRTAHVKDPNHGSAIRPERPPFDSITAAQLERLYDSFRTRLARPLYAVVPTAIFNG